MKYRRFGKTELEMPVISCGGMRYQHSWNAGDDPTAASEANVEACVKRALELGITHFETAQGYGTSEKQLGRILPQLPRDEIIVQTKVPLYSDPKRFSAAFDDSMGRLRLDHVDLLGIHGINNLNLLEDAKRCFELAQGWRREGRIRHLGFSTHAMTPTIVETIETLDFAYVNLHWYYIFQENWPAIEAAAARDMGVFIISPNDKGGMLYEPSQKLVELCAPLHPMVFNGLFCLSRPEVHTLSCGVSSPSDFDAHMETVAKLEEAKALAGPIASRLDQVLEDTLGREWLDTWRAGLPYFHETPGEINMWVILRLWNLVKAFDMVDFAKMRYNLLKDGEHWHPGQKANDLDMLDLSACLKNSPHGEVIPGVLREMHALIGGEDTARLQNN